MPRPVWSALYAGLVSSYFTFFQAFLVLADHQGGFEKEAPMLPELWSCSLALAGVFAATLFASAGRGAYPLRGLALAAVIGWLSFQFLSLIRLCVEPLPSMEIRLWTSALGGLLLLAGWYLLVPSGHRSPHKRSHP